MSFVLTLVNIVCVTLSALLMFHLKRVVPSTQNESFWKRDFLNHARSHIHGTSFYQCCSHFVPVVHVPSLSKCLWN